MDIEYSAQASSPIVNGEVKMKINETALTVAALFDTAEIPFAAVNKLALENHVVFVETDEGDYEFSRMGNWCQPFYDALSDAYNKAVLRSMFIKTAPILTATGGYRFDENGERAGGTASVYVYDNSVAALPPDLSARRVPLCFVSGMDKGDYELTLKLDTGESYTYAKLGYDTAPFAEAVEKQIRALRESTVSAVMEIDPSLTPAQASQIAKIMPQGAAASFGRLAAIAPSFVSALESKLADTRAAESYKVFKELCDPARIYAGFKKNEAASDGVAVSAADLPCAGDEENPPDPYMLWLIAPSPDGSHTAVEFAAEDTATFVYRTGGDFDNFAGHINRALEAIDFKREVIRMSDEEIRRPGNDDYYMAAKRTAALQFVRANFAGRIIHSSADAWKSRLNQLWGG